MSHRRKSNLSSRVRALPRVALEMREPHQIVGTNEWVAVRKEKAFLEGRSTSMESTGLSRNELALLARKRPTEDQGASPTLIDNILNFINETEWAQIEGGEHDGRWINPKHYPNRIFETGQIKEAGSGELHYFPYSTTDEDPKGLAMRFEVTGGGQYCTVVPNTWQIYTSPSTLKQEKREQRKENRDIHRLALAEIDAENSYN